MSDLYNTIHELCKKKGISVGRMCNELGISRGNLTELKMERIKTLKTENLSKIAGYFGVTIDSLLGAEEKAPGRGTRGVEEADIKFALFNGAEDITDEMYEEVKAFARFVQQREREKRNE